MSFTAKYRGTCRDCDDPIHPGQEVEMDDERNVFHVPVCPESLSAWGAPRPVCPRCFCEIPTSGVCGVCE